MSLSANSVRVGDQNSRIQGTDVFNDHNAKVGTVDSTKLSYTLNDGATGKLADIADAKVTLSNGVTVSAKNLSSIDMLEESGPGLVQLASGTGVKAKAAGDGLLTEATVGGVKFRAGPPDAKGDSAVTTDPDGKPWGTFNQWTGVYTSADKSITGNIADIKNVDPNAVIVRAPASSSIASEFVKPTSSFSTDAQKLGAIGNLVASTEIGRKAIELIGANTITFAFSDKPGASWDSGTKTLTLSNQDTIAENALAGIHELNHA
jgi:hypothetical protein